MLAAVGRVLLTGAWVSVAATLVRVGYVSSQTEPAHQAVASTANSQMEI